MDQLPRLADRAAHAQALATRREIVGDAPAEVEGAGAVSTVFPMLTDRSSVGVLEVVTRDALSLRERHLVTGMLRIYRNYLSLLDDSERDTLTGLLNRKTFEQTFGKLLGTPVDTGSVAGPDERRHASAASHPWLGVIDIDHFKAVNDRHGHLIGDEVLLLVTRILHSTFRVQDRLFRFGGEEFVALLQCDGGDQAHAAFERLRANVESYAFPQVGRLTVSIGYAQLRLLDSPSAAFDRADRAVYHAKQHGRNQVCSYDDLVARALILEPGQGGGDVELF